MSFRVPSVSGETGVFMRLSAHARPHAGAEIPLKRAERCAENTNPKESKKTARSGILCKIT